MLERDQIKSILESLLFVNENPIEAKELAEITGASLKDIENIFDEMVNANKDKPSGVCIVKVAGGCQMCSSPENEPWIRKMYQERNKQKLTVAALETLAIIAYKQPITKVEIEAIRGVNVDGVTKNLTNLAFIKIEGRKEVVGRPFLYTTTRKFLEYFGLNSIKDLPKLEEFAALAETDPIVKEITENQTANVVDEQLQPEEVRDEQLPS